MAIQFVATTPGAAQLGDYQPMYEAAHPNGKSRMFRRLYAEELNYPNGQPGGATGWCSVLSVQEDGSVGWRPDQDEPGYGPGAFEAGTVLQQSVVFAPRGKDGIIRQFAYLPAFPNA